MCMEEHGTKRVENKMTLGVSCEGSSYTAEMWGDFADSAFGKEFCISKCVTADACASINPEVAVVLVGVGWTWGI